MPKPDYIRALEWMRDNHADFVPESREDSFPAHWLCLDGSFFLLATIESCETFDEVQELVLGAVAA